MANHRTSSEWPPCASSINPCLPSSVLLSFFERGTEESREIRGGIISGHGTTGRHHLAFSIATEDFSQWQDSACRVSMPSRLIAAPRHRRPSAAAHPRRAATISHRRRLPTTTTGRHERPIRPLWKPLTRRAAATLKSFFFIAASAISSWFGENGTRLLYLVPGELTDKLLPLSVEPAPNECVRVLVGRLETLTPEDCQRLAAALAGNGRDETTTPAAIKAELASLGRFAEPAIQFNISQTSDPTTRDRLEAILTEIPGGT